MEARGRKFLKVVGIILIVFGGISLLMALFSVMGASAIISMGMPAGIMWASIVFSVVASGIQLFAGICGVRYCEVTEKAKTCLILGVIMVVIQVVSAVIGYIQTVQTAHLATLTSGVVSSTTTVMSTVFGLIIGLILPVLYLYGAILNTKSE